MRSKQIPFLKLITTRPQNKYKAAIYTGLRFVLCCLLLFMLLDFIFPMRVQREYAPVVRAHDSTILHAFLTQDQQWRFYTTLEEITPELSKAIVYKEDKYFYEHFGINPIAIIRALGNNLLRSRRTSGASTITMQVARLLEPKKRSYGNKLIEIFRALQLEWHYSKKEILDLYLNLVPYGSNIQGVKAASLLYFNKFPDQLSLAEITTLSIIPNRPNSLVLGKDNARIAEERNKWLQRFQKAALFSTATIQDALQEPLEARRLSAPKLAPQLALRLRRAYPDKLDIVSTINPDFQRRAEDLAANYSRVQKLDNIHNAAVIVLDNSTRAVLAYVGSPDFFDKEHAGQVDGVKAVRSPGSTLKPLLYGLAFDKGMVTPKCMITDIPIDIKGYAPENYDLAYRGRVSVEDALRQSLNIPPVKLLNEMGVYAFVSALNAAGFQSVWNKRNKLGLSMILGGCGVRLDELTALYCTFANQGVYQPLKWNKESLVNPVADSGTRVLSAASSYMVSQILKELHRPDLPNRTVSSQNIPQVAWKTGTSYGRRDAWSIGYNQRYTIGVWIGNFSGKGAPSLNGAGTATPLLFQLFNSLDKQAYSDPVDAPQDLQIRYVCASSGLVPSEHCREQLTDYYIPGISSNRVCEHVKEIFVSADERISYCRNCLPANGYKTKLFENIESELASFYEWKHIPYARIPEHNPVCGRSFDGMAPKINSLNDAATYLITDKGKQQLQLSCAAANDVSKVYWYINNQFLGSFAKSEKVLFIPDNTSLKITCMDDKGRSATIKVKIKFI